MGRKIIFLIFLGSLILNSCTTTRLVTVHVISKDENDRSLSNVDVRLQSNKDIRIMKTGSEGKTTFEIDEKPPYQVYVDFADSLKYKSGSREVTEKDFTRSPDMTEVEVKIASRKTVIYGHVRDKVGNPLTGVTVEIRPRIGSYTLTDEQGNFRIESTAFKNGLIYQLMFSKDRPVITEPISGGIVQTTVIDKNKNTQLKIFKENDFGSIIMDTMVDTTGIDTTAKIILRPSTYSFTLD